ncbi:phosphoadenosine phosphosulfate reductase family protein [Chryseolinea soli]|uniref:Phosphoadenosine phosphosulfate reductase n=1 Tax=Chryseolinea soli TaxID=2321403 RepID=A0A385SR22_9BACT|nr:phosphoadenosine phosphosulfate reductase family protein [Chryseolinea soli]AYB31990.1 phosphoadenosine phosphosulfate reductase [Chryseolinea soli]
MKKLRHVLGISGGKDSAALAIYMRNKFPDIDIEYYTSDTGKELDETYRLVENLEGYLGKKIVRLKAFEDSPEAPFDHKLKSLGGFLPSQRFRWCTKTLKLDVFERFVGDDPVISYVGIRHDEAREGYISKKDNIQSIFPFRRNIWSEDVINKLLAPANLNEVISCLERVIDSSKQDRFKHLLKSTTSLTFTREKKLDRLFDLGVPDFNYLVFNFLQSTAYPLSKCDSFPLLDKVDVQIREDVFKILEDSGVGIPGYYKEIDFEVNGKKSSYCRSRSGCYFCFYQQKIEWVWLYEQHPDKFKLAMEYEKDGYTWNDDLSLGELIQPERIVAIKEEYIKRSARTKKGSSGLLVDILEDSEAEGCASCFI